MVVRLYRFARTSPMSATFVASLCQDLKEMLSCRKSCHWLAGWYIFYSICSSQNYLIGLNHHYRPMSQNHLKPFERVFSSPMTSRTDHGRFRSDLSRTKPVFLFRQDATGVCYVMDDVRSSKTDLVPGLLEVAPSTGTPTIHASRSLVACRVSISDMPLNISGLSLW